VITLSDYLRHKLLYLSIGLNPSPLSVKAGYYFANPRNRFWKALNRSRLVNMALSPGESAMQELFTKYHIGFTDLVKRPTPMGKSLRVADFREGAARLKGEILEYQPEIAWFQGMVAWKNYLKYAEGIESKPSWGPQKTRIGKTKVFVTPNPSPANAQFSIEALIGYYDGMVSYRIREQFGLGAR